MRVSLNEFMADFENQRGKYFGFYDWFCKETSLRKRAMAFLPKLRFLLDMKILNGDTTYVWFKNNCPMDGELYDDMRFSLLDEEDTYLGGIAPSLGYSISKGKCNAWFILPNIGLKQFEFKSWSTFKNELKRDAKLLEEFQNHFYRKEN